MTVWNIIKTQLTRRHRAGSTGYQIGLLTASDIYIEIRPHIRHEDLKESDDVFNADGELTESLLNRRQLEQLGI